MNTRPWYQFTLTINYDRPHLSTIFFPQNPSDYSPIGVQIAAYLDQNNLSSYATVKDGQVGIMYFYPDSDVDVNIYNLVALYQKFKPKGAIKQKMNQQEYVSKEEFEQLKKASAIAEKELQELEQKLNEEAR